MNRVPKVKRGDRIVFRADHWNTFADAANAHIERQLGRGALPRTDAWRPNVALRVRNITGSDQGRGAVLGIWQPVFHPATAEDAFCGEMVIDGRVPDEDADIGRFVVLLGPVPAGKIGYGAVAGVAPVRINVEAEDEDRFADICDGVTDYLTTGPSGSAFVLWREKQYSPPPTTGEQWAYVLIGTPNWFHTGGEEYQVWQLQDIGGGILRPTWDYVRMHP